ncbi:SHUGOSHIN 2-like [Salvia splendens]|uniref:SHUGOSHIN 2-like n=1 Tax=Salvia splendens TaxID=180675 RepID=UPI001C271856|nr:SHUGOSHIN 2-like [Salvia splendens]
MSEKEGFPNLNLLNAAPIGCNNKVEEAARPCPQILARRKLADISNLPQNWKSQPIPTTITKEYVEQLRKENVALAMMLAQRNKIIEQSGIELEKLRSNFIKMRDQNQQLALSHTLLLAELNSRKDRLKQLQHELGCKNGSLQARNSKLEENVIKEDEPSKEGEDHKKPRNAKKRTRSLCLGSSEESQSKDDAGNRLPVRRHSSRFEVFKPDDDSVSEMYDPKIPKCSLPDASVNNEEHVANRPSGRRQSARFKSATPSPIPDETVQENGSSIAEMSVINEGHAVQRPSVRRQSTRLKAVTPCPIPDETVHEISVETVHETSVETSVITEGNDMKRPSVRRQSTRLKAVTQCPIPDETVHETAVETVHETAVETVHETAVETVHETSVETVHETSVETSVITEGHAIQRTSVRKQSIRSRTKIPKQADDPSEMDCTISTNCTSLDEPVPPVTDSGSTSADTPVENENDGSCSSGWGCDSQGSRKPSLGRPSRVATRKVQTYRERSLKDKMRRPV